jgi:hypothetical protein
MKTIRDAVDSFLHFFEDRTGRPSQTLIHPPKVIYYYLNMYHKRVMFQEKTRRSSLNLDEGIIQTLPCVELIQVDVVEVPFTPPSGCYFMKSKQKLPSMLDGIPLSVSVLGSECISCGGDIKEFDYVRWYNMQYKVNSRIPAQEKGLYYTLKDTDMDTHLYVYANNERYPELRGVAVTAIFKEPLEVMSFPICGEDIKPLCNVLDQEFHIEPELEAQVFEYAFQALQSVRGTYAGADLLNNDMPDAAVQNPGGKS